MKNKLIHFTCGFLTLFLFACEAEEEILVPTAVITQIQNLKEGGVEITVDFQNFSEKDKVGYRITSEQFSEEHSITNPKIGRNTISIKNGLFQDKKYYITAYIKTGTDTQTGLEKYLLSRRVEFYATTGSYIPKIESISPAIGYIGDLIEINLSKKMVGAKKEDFKIKFQAEYVHIIDIIDSQKLIIRVPNFISKHQYYRYTWAKMTITYLGKIMPNNFEFNIKAPKITSVSPKLIDWNEEITIKGDFFKEGYAPDYLSVKINDAVITEITKITPNEVRCKVSIHMLDNNPKMVVNSNLKQVTTTNTFSYHAPKIISVQQGAIGDEIEIIGKYFWPASYVNIVYFDSYKAKIITGESTKLVVKIPQGTYVDNKALLKISIEDKFFSEPKEYVFK